MKLSREFVVQGLLKEKSDFFTAHYEQHFKSTKSRNDINTRMVFQVVKQINHIVVMRSFMKPNCIYPTKYT